MSEGGKAGSEIGWMLWLDETPRPGWANMAIDLALLDRAQSGESWLRIYSWKPHCLSFGRHEPASRRYDAGRIAQLGVDVVRRPTGGRAVWHGRELTYAVTAPIGQFGALTAAYLEIHQVLCDSLRSLGVPAALAPSCRTAPVDAGACFASASGGEVLVRGNKVIGSAQLRRDTGLLQHGSVLLDDDQEIVLRVSRGAPTAAAGLPLSALTQQRVSFLEVAQAVARSAAGRWSGAWKVVGDGTTILRSASRYFAQFTSPAWTWAR